MADSTKGSALAELGDDLSLLLSNPPAPTVTNRATNVNDEADHPLRDTWGRLASTNLLTEQQQHRKAEPDELKRHLEAARQLRLIRQGKNAVPKLVAVLRAPDAPDEMRRTAMLELALIAQDEQQLSRALQIFAQYQARWPNDFNVPEVLLREGLIYRQMGLNRLALTKFYATMSTALVLKSDQFDYYRRLVIQAQTEIAETHYQQGNHQHAVEFLTRLMKSDHPALNKSQIHFKLVRSLYHLGQHVEVVSQGQDFLDHQKGTPEQPEVRFLMASAFRHLGRNSESLQQVLLLMQEQQLNAKANPPVWAFWQQRAGNEIANQLYQEGDYAKALAIYQSLVRLDVTPEWQVPVLYQIGVSYERLDQPFKAIETYTNLLGHERELGTNAAPNLKTIFDMARWRRDYINWHSRAEVMRRDLWRGPSTVSEPLPPTTPSPPQNTEAPLTKTPPAASGGTAAILRPPANGPPPLVAESVP
ncbi:MAG: tetratricopeptide repeat protein [Verrucomicrobia bacterium]|nr:tetratricopeptide repeat protein [Verrucomicrobiota bacterium]